MTKCVDTLGDIKKIPCSPGIINPIKKIKIYKSGLITDQNGNELGFGTLDLIKKTIRING